MAVIVIFALILPVAAAEKNSILAHSNEIVPLVYNGRVIALNNIASLSEGDADLLCACAAELQALSTISFKNVVEVCDDKGITVRDSPTGLNKIGAKAKGERGVVIGGPTSAYLNGVSYTWWQIQWAEDDLVGWSAEGYPGGVSYLKPLAPYSTVLTLYVHEGSSNGPLLSGVSITGKDASGTTFSRTTGSSGTATIQGNAGIWSFSASKDGYVTASWEKILTADSRNDAFLKKSDTTGNIHVTSNPSGASITLNGSSQGVTPKDFSGISAGSHTIKLSKPGYSDDTGTVTVTAGQTTNYHRELTPTAPNSPTIETLAISDSDISATSAVLRGHLSNTVPGTQYNVIFRYNKEGAASEDLYSESKYVYGDGQFEIVIHDLLPATTYYYQAILGYPTYIEASSQKSFTTKASGLTTGDIHVTSNPSGASITLDGSSQGVTPKELSGISAGSHTIKLSKSGYNDDTGTVTVTAGQTTDYHRELTLIPTAQPKLITDTPLEVTSTSALLKGRLESGVAGVKYDVCFRYEGGDVEKTKVGFTTVCTTEPDYEYQLTGLRSGTTYYYRAVHKDSEPSRPDPIDASSSVSFNTPASEHPSTVLSPVYGELEVNGSATEPLFSREKWQFWQHKTGGHREGWGIGGADDTYAWDANLNFPYRDTDDGKPVYAIAPGIVTETYGGRSNTDGTFGQVLIEHEYNKDKWWSGYLHLKDIQVKRGDQVTKDTLIGYISNVTGSSSNPISSHLHFALYTGSNELNSLKSFDATITPRLTSTNNKFSPGNRSESSPETISGNSPEFSWPEVSGADYYGFYLSKYPYGAENKIFWSDEYEDGKQIVKPSFSLPAEYTLDPDVTYRWNMRVHTPEKGWGDYSDRRYFKVADTVPNPDKPGVDLFRPANTVIKNGEPVSFEYQVSAPAGLKQVELWRSDTENVWPTDPAGYVKKHDVTGTTAKGTIEDTPQSAGIYWYGIHVVDINDDWSDEGRPVKITVEETTPSPAKFAIGDIVSSTVDDLRVRETPGTAETHKIIDRMISGNRGKIVDGPQTVDKHTWWKVQYDVGTTGWSAEEYMIKAPASPQAPIGFASWAEDAIEWGESKKGSKSWVEKCLKFVANSFRGEELVGISNWYNAILAASGLYRFDQEPEGWIHAPRGAVIFFDINEVNADGHVGIYLGNGRVLHACGVVINETVSEALARSNVGVGRYIGWSYPYEYWRTLHIDSFEPSSSGIKPGEVVSFNYEVSSTGANIARVELWRSGSPGKSEGSPREIANNTFTSGKSAKGSFTDSPGTSDTYWYGLRIYDVTDARIRAEEIEKVTVTSHPQDTKLIYFASDPPNACIETKYGTGNYVYQCRTPAYIPLSELVASSPSTISAQNFQAFSESASDQGDQVEIKFAKHGYQSKTQTITPGDQNPVTVDLIPETPPPDKTDLLISRVWTSGVIRPGKEVQINAEIINDGNISCGPFDVGLWIINDQNKLQLIEKKDISYLSCRSTTTVGEWKFTWPNDYEMHPVIVWADCGEVVPETDKINNLFIGKGEAKEEPLMTPPTALFSTFPTSGTAPLTVEFTDTSTGDPTSWVWDFGDGQSVSGPNPIHTYTDTKIYSVTLTVENACGEDTLTKQGCVEVTGGGVAPTPTPTPGHLVASFTADTTAGPTPLSVQFTDTSAGNPDWWAWYFGDEEFTGPWTMVTSRAEWAWDEWRGEYGGRYGHASVVLPDGSIILMGGRFHSRHTYAHRCDVWRSTNEGATWTQMTAGAGWSGREGHTSVALPDGSIVLMGGDGKNDTWRSTDKGVTWMQMTANAEWSGRSGHTSVALPDGSIVLMGGGGKNDVWRSTDKGATWMQMTANAEWTIRSGHTSVVLLDGSIVLMGGGGKNDVWQSMDKGVTWNQVTASAEWAIRSSHTSVVLPDGSIVLMGGRDESDVWRSTDEGATWTQITASGAPVRRYDYSSVVLPNGNIVLMGGRVPTGSITFDPSSDVWRLETAGSTEQHPVHTYTTPDTYTASLTVANMGGSDIATKNVTVTKFSELAPVAVFTANTTAGPAPLIVQFTDLSPGSPTARFWDFGDNTTSTEQDLTHTYTTPGTYTVNLTVTNTAGSSSATATITVTDAAACDLTIGGVPNPIGGVVFAREPNTIRVTNIRNNGPGASPATVLEVRSDDGWAGRVDIPPIEAGEKIVIISIEDPTIRNLAGGTVTYTAEIDPDNTAIETDETNNIKPSPPKAVKYNGYKGKRYWEGGSDITTVRTYDLRGGIMHSFGDSRYVPGGKPWTSYTVTWTVDDLPLPASASVRDAWLYVPYSWDDDNTAPDGVSIDFNGVRVPYENWYTDVSNFGPYVDHHYGLLTYNVTSLFQKDANNTALFERDRPGKISPAGFTLAVVYEDASATRKQIFVNEEFDLLGADPAGYGTNETEATAYVPFSGMTIDTGNVVRADLTTFVPWGDCGDGTRPGEGNLLFNDELIQEWVWDYGEGDSTQVAVDERDVRSRLRPTGNIAGIQGTEANSPTMVAAQVFLVVEYGESVADFTANVTAGPAPLTVGFTGTSTGNSISRLWGFGDGSTSTEKNPVYTYRRPGTYTVNLTINTPAGSDTLSRSDYITVTPPRGDVNGDGIVDISDVAKVAYMVVGKEPADLAADFNGNERVDIGDAAKIAYFVVGEIDTL